MRVYSLYPTLVETRMQEALQAATPDRLPSDRRQFFIDQKETGKVLAPEFPAHIITWLCSTDCDVESGAVIYLRNQPELLARIDWAWGLSMTGNE